MTEKSSIYHVSRTNPWMHFLYFWPRTCTSGHGQLNFLGGWEFEALKHFSSLTGAKVF